MHFLIMKLKWRGSGVDRLNNNNNRHMNYGAGNALSVKLLMVSPLSAQLVLSECYRLAERLWSSTVAQA